MDSGGKKDTPEEERDNRLVCLDTESSICLDFDRSLYSSNMFDALDESKSLDLNTKPELQMLPVLQVSSETNFIPCVREVHGSSDSQQRIPSIPAGQSMAGNDSIRSIHSSNQHSVLTAELAYAGDTEEGMQGVSDVDTEMMDRELQAAVDMMLNGETTAIDNTPTVQSACVPPHSRNRILGSARFLTGKLFRPNETGALVPVDLHSRAPEEPPTHTEEGAQHSTGGGRRQQLLNLPKLVLGRLSRHKHERSPAYSEGDVSMSSLEKDATERKIADVPPEQKTTVRAACCLPDPVVGPQNRGRIGRMLAPVTKFVQQRPMASLGIALAALVSLLVILIVVLVACVFPFLMRSTLQDVSFVLTEVHALPPAEVSRELLVHNIKKLPRPHAPARHARVAEEMDSDMDGAFAVPLRHEANGHGHGLWPRDLHSRIGSDLRPLQRIELIPAELSSAVRIGVTSALLTSQSTEPMSARVQSAVPKSTVVHSRPASSFLSSVVSSPHGLRQEMIEDVVTVTSVSINTVHVPMARATAAHVAVPTSHGNAVSAAAPVATGVSEIERAMDAEKKKAPAAAAINAPSTSYMLQVAGNLTSGGPIGVHIEFTEPLQMMWHDVQVGVIEQPVGIHVPGRGTAQWTWPPVEVSIPASTTSRIATAGSSSDKANRRMDKKTDAASSGKSANDDAVVMDTGVAQRRVLGGAMALGRSSSRFSDIDDSEAAHEALTSWFDAIQAHRPFTMIWRSRVKVSAMGLHTNDVRFEKTVSVVCGESRNCTIDGSSFALA
ncbi:hypothetical protein GGI07_000933 [Coemansia sp. Benny D115]|nr:hypothetical protein GGI07_000933 [Coemansia sp. Benny D115]